MEIAFQTWIPEAERWEIKKEKVLQENIISFSILKKKKESR